MVWIIVSIIGICFMLMALLFLPLLIGGFSLGYKMAKERGREIEARKQITAQARTPEECETPNAGSRGESQGDIPPSDVKWY